MKEFLLDNKEFITKFVEILAALSGTIYLRITENKKLSVFVYYLWLTVAVEFLGRYTFFMQNNFDNELFIQVKNSSFCYNTWFYNIYNFIGIGLLGVFYSNLLISKTFKIIIRSVFILYCVFTLGFFTLIGGFFKSSVAYDFILGTGIVCIYIVLYFIELMKSDYLLSYYKLPSFYISIALLVWYICATPLFIFDSYFRAVNTDFVMFRTLILLTVNIFAFVCIIFGFLYPLYKSKQLIRNR